MKTTFALALTLAAASVAVAQPVNGNLENTFRALKQEKTKVYLSLDRLTSYHPMLMSYESHATEWTTVKDGLNRSGALLRTLEQQRGAMSPAQAARFDSLKAQLAEVAADTQEMITRLRENQRYIAMPAYLTAVKQLTAKASNARTQAIEILALSAGQGASPTGD
jgi:hypothetical protein